jgi:AcrR family transcriptional regulator
MRHEFGSVAEPGVLTPTIPQDIGARSIRQRILGAMAKSCAEKTFACTTIADIVAGASISRATFYKHFENKGECFDAAAEEFMIELRGVALEASSASEAPSEATRDAISAILQRLSEKPAFARLLLMEAPNVNPSIVPRCRDLVIDAMDNRWRKAKTTDRSGPDARIAYGRANVLLADHLSGGDGDGHLTSLMPEVLYIALMPYIGQDKALELAGGP